jgi:hypothetical protein
MRPITLALVFARRYPDENRHAMKNGHAIAS